MDRILENPPPDKLSPEHKKKTKTPLITTAIKPCTYQGTKGSVEVLDIKVPVRQTTIQMAPHTQGAIPKQKGVSISLGNDFTDDPGNAERDNYKEITYIGHGPLTAIPKVKGQHGGFFNRMTNDVEYRTKFLQSLSIFWAFSVLVSHSLTCIIFKITQLSRGWDLV